MKKALIAILAAAFLSAPAFAVPLLLGSAQLQPDNPATEEAYLENTLLGGLVDVTLFANNENLNGSSYTLDALCPAPLITFVVLKWGGQGGGTQQFFALAQSEPLPVVFNQPAGLGELSHVRIFCSPVKGTPFDIPVPDSGATLGLLGLSVASLFGFRRKLA